MILKSHSNYSFSHNIRGIFGCFKYLNILVLVQIIAYSVAAQPGQSEEANLLSKPRGLYLGVKPGEQNYAPGKELQANQGLQRIVWVGFQARRDRAQVFVQTDAPPLFEVAESDPKTVIVDFPNAVLHTKNDGQHLM